MFKSQLEPPSDNFMETQIFVENIFDTVKKAREAKAAARSLAESKITAFDLSPSKRKKTRKNAKGKRAKATPTKKKQRKPRTPKEPKRTPRKYTKRAKVIKPQNDIDDEEAAFILSSISQRSFDSFYNRLNGSSSVVIPLEQSPQQQQQKQQQKQHQQVDHVTAYHHVLLDHNYWVAPQQQQQQQPEVITSPTIPVTPPAAPTITSSEVNNNNCDATNTNAVKKRWLRQATNESTSPTVTPPETSPNDMLKAPLKKRKVVQETTTTNEIIIKPAIETEMSKIDQTSSSSCSNNFYKNNSVMTQQAINMIMSPVIKMEEQQPLNMTMIKSEIKSEILPYAVDKLKEIHEKIEMDFGRKNCASVIQSPHTSVIQRVNCHGNSVIDEERKRVYGEVLIKSPEKGSSVRFNEIYDGSRRMQDHQIKIELHEQPQQQPSTPFNHIQVHQNHLYNIKTEVFDTKPPENLKISPFDNKIQKILGENLLIKPEIAKNISPPKIQFVGEGFQKIQQNQPNVIHKIIHKSEHFKPQSEQNVQIIYNDKCEQQQQQQQIVHESIFKIDNNVYKIIENVPRVGEVDLYTQQPPLQQPVEKKPKKLLKTTVKATKVKKVKSPKAQKQPKKPKKSPQKSPKKPRTPKSPTKATKAKQSPVKIDKEFMKNFADIEDVPLKIRQNLSNAFKIEELLGKKKNEENAQNVKSEQPNVRNELLNVIEAVNANPLKFDGNYPKFDGSYPKFQANMSKFDGNNSKIDGNLQKIDGNLLKFDEIKAKLETNHQNHPKFEGLYSNYAEQQSSPKKKKLSESSVDGVVKRKKSVSFSDQTEVLKDEIVVKNCQNNTHEMQICRNEKDEKKNLEEIKGDKKNAEEISQILKDSIIKSKFAAKNSTISVNYSENLIKNQDQLTKTQEIIDNSRYISNIKQENSTKNQELCVDYKDFAMKNEGNKKNHENSTKFCEGFTKNSEKFTEDCEISAKTFEISTKTSKNHEFFAKRSEISSKNPKIDDENQENSLKIHENQENSDKCSTVYSEILKNSTITAIIPSQTLKNSISVDVNHENSSQNHDNEHKCRENSSKILETSSQIEGTLTKNHENSAQCSTEDQVSRESPTTFHDISTKIATKSDEVPTKSRSISPSETTQINLDKFTLISPSKSQEDIMSRTLNDHKNCNLLNEEDRKSRTLSLPSEKFNSKEKMSKMRTKSESSVKNFDGKLSKNLQNNDLMSESDESVIKTDGLVGKNYDFRLNGEKSGLKNDKSRKSSSSPSEDEKQLNDNNSTLNEVRSEEKIPRSPTENLSESHFQEIHRKSPETLSEQLQNCSTEPLNHDSEPQQSTNSISLTLDTPQPEINQQVASILEKVISRTLKSDQEVPTMEAITSDEEDDTQYRESVEEFHKDTLEKLMQANKRFYRENYVQNPFRGGYEQHSRGGSRSFDYEDHRRPLKASLSYESQYPPHHHHPPPFNRSVSERWGGNNGSYENNRNSYGSFHYDKIHHREPITTTYSMYRAQKASHMDGNSRWNNNNPNNHQQPAWNNRVVAETVPVVVQQPPIQQAPSPIIPIPIPVQPVITTPEILSPQAEALKNATSEAFGGFLKEKLNAGAAMLPKTKTASSDPRLNPSLVQDTKKDESATPKKKLSLDQYRKRKSLTSITPLSTPEESINSNSKSPSPTLPPAFDPSIAAAAATG